MSRPYFAYILASRSRSLYVGATNNLERRIAEHRAGFVPGFTSRYRIFRLVYFEVFGDLRSAIAREKKIKAWRREKKIWLIERQNPTWEELATHPAEQRGRGAAKREERTADPSRRIASGLPSVVTRHRIADPEERDRVRDDIAGGSKRRQFLRAVFAVSAFTQ